MTNIILFLSIFIVFFILKYISTFFYKERYLKIITIDSFIISLYGVVIGFLGVLMENDNDPIGGVLWALTFFVIIPYIYAFIKPKILRKYFHWEVGMYYPVIEFLVIIGGYLLLSLVVMNLLDALKLDYFL